MSTANGLRHQILVVRHQWKECSGIAEHDLGAAMVRTLPFWK
jgi:hypothetical protein